MFVETHGNPVANARQISQWLGFGGEDRLLTMMPLFHMNAVSVTTMSALYAGASDGREPKFSASRFWQDHFGLQYYFVLDRRRQCCRCYSAHIRMVCRKG